MPTPGLYVVNASGEMSAVMVEDDSGDFDLLEEFLHERGFKLETRDIESFLEPAGTSIVCEGCGHVRPTTEENPTLASCEECGSHDLRYADE